MMRHCLVLLIVFLFSCNQSRNSGTNEANYDVITQKCYVVRNVKPVSGDALEDSVMRRQQEIAAYLEQHAFSRHVAAKDSLLFRRDNGQEVIMELPVPQDAWEAHTIIVFNPRKNPLFVNLHKDTTQVAHYLK